MLPQEEQVPKTVVYCTTTQQETTYVVGCDVFLLHSQKAASYLVLPSYSVLFLCCVGLGYHCNPLVS